MKTIYRIVDEDIQEVATEKLARELTSDEMLSAKKYFENGIQWWDVAECAVDLAVEDHK